MGRSERDRQTGVYTYYTFGFLTLERLLEGGDVAESAQEEDDDVALIFNGRYLQEQPQRRTCANDQLDERREKTRKIINLC